MRVELPETGFIKDYVETFEPVTEAPRQYHVGVALILLSIAIGRQAYIEVAGRMYLNLYLLILGPSTQTRKSTAMRLGEITLSRAAKLHPSLFDKSWSLPSGTLSSEAMVSRLDEQDRALLKLDEFGRLLSGAANKAYMVDSKELITEVYGCWNPGRLTRGEVIEAGPCYLSILAATTRSRFEEEITAEDVSSGFLGRFLIVYAHGTDKVLPFPPSPDEERVVSVVNRLARIAEAVKGEVTFSPEARQVIGDWYVLNRKKLGASEDADMALPIFFRLDGIVRKLSALMEASTNPRPDMVITEASAREAVAYADFLLDQQRTRLLDGVLGDLALKLRKLKETVHAAPGIRKSALMKKVNINEPEFSKLIRLLADEDEIEVRSGQGRNKRGLAFYPASPEASR